MNFLYRRILEVILVYTVTLTLIYLIFSSDKNSNSEKFIQSIENQKRTNIHFNESQIILTPNNCKSHTNVYTEEELKSIFNYDTASPCRQLSKNTYVYENGQFHIYCANLIKPMYGLPRNNKETYGGSKTENLYWIRNVPKLDEKQFIFIRCSVFSIESAFVFNRFSKKASDSANEIKKKLGDNEKQMSVLVLVLDSVSRYSLQRNLYRTKSFLDELEQNEKFNDTFHVYEFEKSATPKAFTVDNIIPIWYGKPYEKILEELQPGQLKDSDKEKYIRYQENAIWKHFSSLGYVTMFTHATAFDYLASITGRYIQTDHVFNSFWRYIWGVIGLSDFEKGKKCVGNNHTHEFLFDYTYQFFDNYPNNNKFAYAHSNAAHETSGNVRNIDQDLVKFLNKFLGLIKERNENLAIFFISDHGHKKPVNSQWDVRTFFEHHTPFTYLIATKEVIQKMKADENLKYNRDKLVSRLDINLSLKHLSYMPYNFSLESWYIKAKESYAYNTLSVFEEKISPYRTCSDIGVPNERCLCQRFEPIEQNDDNSIIKTEMTKLFSQYLLDTAKTQGNCLINKKIKNMTTLSFTIINHQEQIDKLYKLEIRTEKNNVISIYFNFCLKSRIEETNNILPLNEHPLSYIQIKNGTYFIQLSNLVFPANCISDICDC